MRLDPRDRRIHDEIEHHLAELQRRLIEEGLTPDEARAEAARRFGDARAVARSTRDVSGSGRSGLGDLVDTLRQDVSFALRQLVAQPLLSALTLATITVGVAAPVVVFSIVHAVVLQPLPFAEPDRLVSVNQTSPQGRRYSVSEPNFVDFRARQSSFTDLTALGFVTATLEDTDGATAVDAMRVSASFFTVLGVEPTVGRAFLPEEDVFGADARVALLSEGAWRRRFGGDRDVVGASIRLDGASYEVVGVVPSDVAWPGVEVLMPLAPNPDEPRDDQRLAAIGRLGPGVDIDRARADLEAIAAELSAQYPQSNDGWGAAIDPLRDQMIGDRLTRMGAALLGIVTLFLFMACASLSNLLLTRATARLTEMRVRAAMGAGRGRILAQLATEGGVLSLVGGGLAVALSGPAVRAVKMVGPADVVRLGDASVNGTVLAVATLATVVTVFLAGLAPALLLAGPGGAAPRRARGSVGGGGGRVRDLLVTAQYALGVTVLVSAGLLTRSFFELQRVETGFEPDGVLSFTVRLPEGPYDMPERERFVLQLRDELMALPGVQAVGSTSASPFSRWRPSNFVARSDREPDRQEDFVPVSWRAVTGEYFAAAGVPVLAGRVFGPESRAPDVQALENPPVVIDEVLAETLFPDGEDPIGRRVTWFLPGGPQYVVIGVVASARDEVLDALPRPRIYRPFTFTWWEEPGVLVRVAGDPTSHVATVRRVVSTLDPSVPVISPIPLRQQLSRSIAWPRFGMQVLLAFGLVALGLAAMGIYGVTAFSVARRGAEIGLRVALGAEPSSLRWMILAGAVRRAVVGIAVGVPASFAVVGLLRSILYDVSTTDPTTFGVVVGVLMLVAFASAWLPARRVLRIAPRDALASE